MIWTAHTPTGDYEGDTLESLKDSIVAHIAPDGLCGARSFPTITGIVADNGLTEMTMPPKALDEVQQELYWRHQANVSEHNGWLKSGCPQW